MSKIINCSFCSGNGKDPFALLSVLSHCLVCDGTGQVEIAEPAVDCAFCSGTGKNPLGARVACIVCGGKGMNHVKNMVKCIQCKGSAKSTDGLPCTYCGGKGLI